MRPGVCRVVSYRPLPSHGGRTRVPGGHWHCFGCFSGERFHERARMMMFFFIQSTSLIDVELSFPRRFSVSLSSPRCGKTLEKTSFFIQKNMIGQRYPIVAISLLRCCSLAISSLRCSYIFQHN